MELYIIVSRFSNLLFFAQKAEVFNDELQKYLTDEHADMSFYGKNKGEILKKFEKSAEKQNIKQLKESIALINSDFSSHWNNSSKQLLLWKQYFQKNQLLLLKAVSSIKKLCGIKKFTLSNIPIYLISAPFSKDKEINAWFSWTPKETFLVVEIPAGLNVPKDSFPLSVLVHEFFHLMLRKNKKLILNINEISKKNEKLLSALSGGMPCRMFLEELLVSSFIPEGYLGEIKFKTRVVDSCGIKPKSLLDWRKFVASNLYSTTKNYVNNNRAIDDKYFEELLKITKNL